MSLPDFLTIEETAEVLRIGRTAAYAQAARYEATDGAEGIPVVRFGRLLRVPRAQLERIAGGQLTEPSAPRPRPGQKPEPERPARERGLRARRHERDQPALPFTS